MSYLAISKTEGVLKETGTAYPFRASRYTPVVCGVRVVSNVGCIVGLSRYACKISFVDCVVGLSRYVGGLTDYLDNPTTQPGLTDISRQSNNTANKLQTI
jgi:hypothetical protein